MSLKRLSTVSTQLLAVFGLVSVLFAVGNWLYNKVYFRDALAIVRPICERVLFPVAGSSGVPVDGSWRLVGVSILTFDDLRGSRLLLRNFSSVVSWAAYSDGLTEAEKEAALHALPTGLMTAAATSETLPVFPKDSVTTLLAIAKPKYEGLGLCEADSVEILASGGKVYHADPVVSKNYIDIQVLPGLGIVMESEADLGSELWLTRSTAGHGEHLRTGAGPDYRQTSPDGQPSNRSGWSQG